MRRSDRNKLKAAQQKSGATEVSGKKSDRKLSAEEILRQATAAMRLFDAGEETIAQVRFQKLFKEAGLVPVMEVVSSSDTKAGHKIFAARLALAEKNNDALNAIIHTLGFVLHDRHSKLVAEAEPLALYLSALQRRETAFDHRLGNGQTVDEIVARVHSERPNLIPDIVKLQPVIAPLFPDYTPPVRETFRAATPAVVAAPKTTPAVVQPKATVLPAPQPIAAPIPVIKTDAPPPVVIAAPKPVLPAQQPVVAAAPAPKPRLSLATPPVKRVSVAEKTIEAPAERSSAIAATISALAATAKIYPDVIQLQAAVTGLMKKAHPRTIYERDADMMEAIALIDANAAHGTASNQLRNLKGEALFDAGFFENACAHIELVLQGHWREHMHDSYTHVLYAKILRRLGRAADGEKHLGQRIGVQGLLRQNGHVHNAFASCVRETKGTDAALAHYDALPKSQDARFNAITQQGRTAVQRLPFIAPPKASIRLLALVASGEANYHNALVHRDLIAALRNEGTPQLAQDHIEMIFGPCGRFAGNDHAAKAFDFPPTVKVQAPITPLPQRKGPLFSEPILCLS